jgi:hypothetical protein
MLNSHASSAEFVLDAAAGAGLARVAMLYTLAEVWRVLRSMLKDEAGEKILSVSSDSVGIKIM